METKFFSLDPDGDGLQMCDTAEEAREAADNAISESRGYLCDPGCNPGEDGWPGTTKEICWGELRPIQIAGPRQYPVPEEESEGPDDSYTEYELKDVPSKESRLLAEVVNLLESASPHPGHHPAMHAAWVQATATLAELGHPVIPNYLK